MSATATARRTYTHAALYGIRPRGKSSPNPNLYARFATVHWPQPVSEDAALAWMRHQAAIGQSHGWRGFYMADGLHDFEASHSTSVGLVWRGWKHFAKKQGGVPLALLFWMIRRINRDV